MKVMHVFTLHLPYRSLAFIVANTSTLFSLALSPWKVEAEA